MAPSLNQVLEYLTDLFEAGRSYRTVNLHRSMLSSTLSGIEGASIGKHPMVSKLLRAIYNRRTPKAKYSSIWDADLVLNKLKELGPNESLSLKQITLKTVLILALATFARVSELASINHRSLWIEEERLTFSILKPRKSQSSGPLATFQVQCLEADREICPVKCVTAYVEATKSLRSQHGNKLFIALKPPHEPVGGSSIARWIKVALGQAGVNTSVFSAHSTRGAAASKALANGIPCDQILAAASWKRASTFHRFYNRRIEAGDLTGARL